LILEEEEEDTFHHPSLKSEYNLLIDLERFGATDTAKPTEIPFKPLAEKGFLNV